MITSGTHWFACYKGELEISPSPENNILERIINITRTEFGTNMNMDKIEGNAHAYDDCIKNGSLKCCIKHINAIITYLNLYYNVNHVINGFVKIIPDGYTILKMSYDPSLDMLLVINNIWYEVKDPDKMHTITFKKQQYTVADQQKINYVGQIQN